MLYIILHLILPIFVGAPTDYICEVNFSGRDPQGELKVELTEKLFFTYTNEELKEHLTDREILTCYSSMVYLKGQDYMVLRVEMASTMVAKTYGNIPTGSPVKLTFLNGKHVFVDMVNSEWRTESGTRSYVLLAKIEKDDARMIRKCGIDKLGLIWDSGFEEYEIYDVDLLKNQLQCLNKHS
jgi:hypothetical protein